MSHNEYVKFMTEQLVTYMNKTKREKKLDKKTKDKPMFSNHWFGLFPLTIKLMFKK